MFFRFIRTCKKYRFDFVLSKYGKVTLMLRPIDTFKNINFEGNYYDLKGILSKGIKAMKDYRKNEGC